MLFIFVPPIKLYPRYVIPSGNSNSSKLLQHKNASSPIAPIFEDKVIVSNDVQPLNALYPILTEDFSVSSLS